jgi:hypothetical protein
MRWSKSYSGARRRSRDHLLPLVRGALGGVARPAPEEATARPAPPGNRTVRLTFPAGRELKAVAERVRVDLHGRGIEARLEELDPPAFRAALAGSGYQVLLLPINIMGIVVALVLARSPRLRACRCLRSSSARWRRSIPGTDGGPRRGPRTPCWPMACSFRSSVASVRGGARFGRELEVDPSGCAVLEGSWRWPFP